MMQRWERRLKTVEIVLVLAFCVIVAVLIGLRSTP
jgi:hypothetical protein